MERYLLRIVAPLFALLAGCGEVGSKACTEIGCADGLTLDFSTPLKMAGKYTVVVDADGQQTTCEATLPFADCLGGPACSSADVLLGQSGCALPADQHSLIGLQMPAKSPAKVTVTIQRDGQPVAMESFDPTYKTSMPNGPGCEPVCKQASVTMTTS